MSTLKFVNVNKIYQNKVQAVFDFNLEVADKEFIVFVGPSGCGKSTTLRMVAGLEEITDGEIYIDGQLINTMQPKDRNIAMVFQNYALYPHMTVFDNIAFSLKQRKFPFEVEKNGEKTTIERYFTKEEIKERVNDVAETLGLVPYLQRKPAALSGGQRQRVALGRAIVRQPKVFLMDEPLSNLDAKLRVQMRSEIAKIHKKANATTIYVTHDQTEAMTMASRIVCMKDGYIQQIGTPSELFNSPANMFVAGFIGSPAMNFIEGKFDGKKFIIGGKTPIAIDLKAPFAKSLKEYVDKEVVLGIRPEDIYLKSNLKAKNATNAISLKCDISELLGRELIVYTDVNGQKLVIKVEDKDNIQSEDTNEYCFDFDHLHFFDKETTLRII